MDRTFYAVLGVAEDATPAEIRAAFRRMARDGGYHPDAGGTDADFIWLTKIRDGLLDPQKRAAYDRHLAQVRGEIRSDPKPEPEPEHEPDQTPARSSCGSEGDIENGWSMNLLITLLLLVTGHTLYLMATDDSPLLARIILATFWWAIEVTVAGAVWVGINWAVGIVARFLRRKSSI